MDEPCELSDPVFNDMGMSDIADRRKFLEVCRVSFDQREDYDYPLVFGDWKISLSLLVQMRQLNIHSENVYRWLRLSGDFKTDADGRINQLTIDICDPRDLPKGIHRLDRLENLTFPGMEMTPLLLRQVSCLSKLRRLRFDGISMSFSDAAFPLVRTLQLRGSHYFQLLHTFPSVEELTISMENPAQVDRTLDQLGSLEMEKLQQLVLQCAKMNGEQCAKIMLEVVPRFPNLETLQFSMGDTKDLRVLTHRLRSDKSCLVSKSLRRLVLTISRCEPELVNAYSGFKADMLTVLKFFVTVNTISWQPSIFCFSNIIRRLCHDPDWRYAVTKNSVGRRILKHGGERKGSNNTRLPPSVWSIVLQRAQRKIGQYCSASDSATGIYYLLREGPALIGRRDLVGDPDRSWLSSPPPAKRQKRA